MSHQVRKTVVIGLGGTGRDAVLHVKRKYLEVYGTDDLPTTRFLVLDTTDDRPLEGEDGQRVSLQPSEFYKMEVTNPRQVVRVNPEVKSWFPDDGSVPLGAITKGAGQVRAVGRLGLFANASQVYSRIKQAFNGVNSISPIDDLGDFELLSDDLLVNVVGSLSGGTGSGTFLDVAFLCRKFMTAQDTLVAYLLLPDVFVGKPATQNVQPNTYGALKELDLLMNRSNVRSTASYQFGGENVPSGIPPFDIVYLMNNRNKNEVVYQDVEDVTELLGTGIFISSGAAGKDAIDVWDNLGNQINALGSFNGKNALYSSFGVSELVLNTEEAARELAYRIAIRTLENAFLGVDSTDVSDHVDEFITSNGLCEHEADQVIDELLPPNAYRRLRRPDSVDKETIDDLFRRRSGHIGNVESQTRTTCRETREQLEQEKLERIFARIKDELSRPGGLGYAKVFLEMLLTKFKEYRAEMHAERDELRERRRGMDGRLKALRADAEQAKSKWFGFGSSKLLEETAENLVVLTNDEGRIVAEAIRRNEAGVFYTTLINELSQLLSKLSDLSDRLELIHSDLAAELEHLRSQHQHRRPFTAELKLPREELNAEGAADANDFLVWLREQDESVLDMAELQSEDLEGQLLEFALSRSAVRRIINLHIEDVLEGLTDEELADYIEALDRLAVPLWKYNEAYTGGGKSTETIYLFGVPNATNTYLSTDRIGEMLSTEHLPQLTSTGDPHRIFCYRIEAAVPAFIVSGMQTYKMHYENPDAPFTYHVHKEWSEEASDLWPNADEDSRRVWSLANADPFNLIQKRGSYYYAQSVDQGRELDNHEVKLAQGRENALKALLENSQLLNELEEEIQQISRSKGANRIAGTLEEYVEELRNSNVRKSSTRELIEEEIQDVRDYIEEIMSIS